MSSIEERLARDIEAVTGGVVVTQADVEQARERVEDRIERTGRDRRRWVALAAAAAAAAVVGAGTVALTSGPDPEQTPAGPGPEKVDALSDGSVQGVWRVDNGVTLVRFGSDGSVAIDTRGQITTPEIAGSYTLDGDRVVMDLDEGRQAGCTGEVVLGASVAGPGKVQMTPLEPVPGGCGFEQAGQWVLEHLLPTRRGYTDFGPPVTGDYGPLRREVLPGFWMVVGGGTGLQLDAAGTYTTLDDSGEVIEEGRWRLEDDEVMLINPRGCRVGISDVEHIDPGTDMLRGELTEYTCETDWVTGDGGDTMAWFKVPDRTS